MLPSEISALLIDTYGPPENLKIGKRPMPVAGEGEVLVKVAAAGVNRADVMQRQGKYPPPAGASDIPGMEISGIVAALGPNVSQWKTGDKICALLNGGGYADYVAVPEGHCLPVPDNMKLQDAAALPEAMITVYANLFESGALKSGETALIHGGSSGIGTMAIQMVKARGASVIVTVRTHEKREACYALGADFAVVYDEEDFVDTCRRATAGRGVDVVLDMVGGDYVVKNLTALCVGGRHVSIASQKGAKAEIDIRMIMQKRLVLTGSTLRGRDRAEKARLVTKLREEFWPGVATQKIKPVIYQRFPLKDGVQAHKMMENGAHIGKILLEIP
ncbi:MAG: NAD(P)H-quinone oxidoreductase [Alphaproteobacteria bacterium]|nr:NAD(P)H-quinone oxidoreductase [Alphaproteobacteria bacterium]